MMRAKAAVTLVALVLLAPVLGPADSPVAATTTPATITARLSPPDMVVNTTGVVTGTVTPAKATPTVYLQRKIGDVWYDRGSAPVDRTTGAYRLSLRPSQRGSYALRVRSAGGGVISRTFYAQVWASKRVLSGEGTTTVADLFLAGGAYAFNFSYPQNCLYTAHLMGPGGRPNFVLDRRRGPTSITRKLDDVARQHYRLMIDTAVDDNSDPGATCPWTVKIWRR